MWVEYLNFFLGKIIFDYFFNSKRLIKIVVCEVVEVYYSYGGLVIINGVVFVLFIFIFFLFVRLVVCFLFIVVIFYKFFKVDCVIVVKLLNFDSY